MAKLYTPAMAKVDKKKARELRRHQGKEVRSTPAKEAWKRLKRNRLAIVGMIVLILIIIVAGSACHPDRCGQHRNEQQQYQFSQFHFSFI